MVAPEAIGPLQRYAALVAEQPIIRLAEPLARQLGLREGQIIQASLQMEADGVALKLEERLFMLPAGWQRFASGDMRWFQVTRQAGGLMGLKLLPHGTPTPSGASGSGLPASLQPGALGQGVSASTSAPASPLSGALHAHLSSLLSRPLSFDSLFNVLRPGVLESAVSAQRGSAHLAAAMSALRLRVDTLSPQSVQQAFLASGLWSETMLSMGRANAALDLKALLRQVLRSIGARSSVGEQIESALSEIERTQVESIQAQVDQRQVFSLMLPFADAEPALLRFEREPRRFDRAPQRYIIDLHLRPAQIGELWIKTAVIGKSVELTVWTARPEVARIVQRFSDELNVELVEAGLSLQSLQVIDRPRSNQAEPSPTSAHSSVDLRA